MRQRAAAAFACRRAWFLSLAVVFALPAAGDDLANTIAAGVYTDAQADAGEPLYERHCLTCHDKKYFRERLKLWHGQSLHVFFMTMATTMPENNPGVLYDDEYVDILAYILSISRYASGEVPLDATDGSFDRILIGAPAR